MNRVTRQKLGAQAVFPSACHKTSLLNSWAEKCSLTPLIRLSKPMVPFWGRIHHPLSSISVNGMNRMFAGSTVWILAHAPFLSFHL